MIVKAFLRTNTLTGQKKEKLYNRCLQSHRLFDKHPVRKQKRLTFHHEKKFFKSHLRILIQRKQTELINITLRMLSTTMVVEIFKSVNKLLENVRKSVVRFRYGRGCFTGKEFFKGITRGSLDKVNVKMRWRKRMITFDKLKGAFLFSLDAFDTGDEEKFSQEMAEVVFLSGGERSHEVAYLMKKKPGGFVAYAKVFRKHNTVHVTFTDNGDSTEPGFE